MTTAVIALTAMVLCVYLLSVEGGTVCQVRGKGKLKQFNSKKVSVSVPCKFNAVTFNCEGYKIHVAPGMALDFKNRYYTTSAWVMIVNKDAGLLWGGRTSSMRLARIFNGTKIPAFKTKKGSLDGDSVQLKMEKNPGDQSVTLKASDASWKIYFYGFDANDRDLRKTNGVKIQCKEPVFDPELPYPRILCGDGEDSKAVDEAKRSLGLQDRTMTVTYHILENMHNVSQTSDLCDSAGTLFQSCAPEDRAAAVRICGPLLSHRKAMRHMAKFNLEPMQEFLSCMRFKCNNDIDSCELVTDHMAGCDAFSITSCPARA